MVRPANVIFALATQANLSFCFNATAISEMALPPTRIQSKISVTLASRCPMLLRSNGSSRPVRILVGNTHPVVVVDDTDVAHRQRVEVAVVDDGRGAKTSVGPCRNFVLVGPAVALVVKTSTGKCWI